MKKNKCNTIKSKVLLIKKEDKHLLRNKLTAENSRLLKKKREDWKAEPEINKEKADSMKVTLKD